MQTRQRASPFAVSEDKVAMDKTVVHTKLPHLYLWLKILIILSSWPLTGFAQHTSLPEVVIPLQVTGNRPMWAMGWLTYSLHFGGQKHFIYMKAKKFLVSRLLSVFTYTKQGALHKDQPYVQKDCYYHGYMDGDPEFMVAITTCSGGFQGILQVNGTVYEIKPKNLSATFEHLVHKIDREGTELLPMRCALTEEIARQLKLQKNENLTLMQSHYEGWWTHKRFLDLALVIDRERIRYHNDNSSHVLVEVFTIINIINKIYQTLDLELVLLGVELWNERNHVPIHNIDVLLYEFCIWKTRSLNFRIPNDIAHLFVNHHFGIYLGLAYVGTVCMPSLNCGIDRLIGHNLFYFGHIIAHEMGHNLGMQHDEGSCTCGAKDCLMAPTDSGIQKFSNCSYSAFWTTYATANCMRKETKPLGSLKSKRCGNGVVDDGEQCDCGSAEMCARDPCCKSSCTLKDGATCAFGLCCTHCRVMPSGTVCREQVNECDLPEWCNGHSYKCPNDVYLLDGSPCRGGGYCYEKRCNNRNEQCKQIFGQEARSAAQSCYRELNTRGDRFGNCGMIRDAYLRCHDSDILCGRLQCENVTGIPLLQDHSTVHWTRLNGVTCWGTDYHFGMTIPDVGFVKDGTDCSPEHVCINRKCVNKSIWISQCSPKTCNMKGVCNNLHHCHCDLGWDPPYCLESGFGGSVDSGPLHLKEEKPKESRKPVILICILFACFSLLFIVFLFLLISYVNQPKSKESNVPSLENTENDTDVRTSSATNTL
ncbi:a disintegrin and metallopeptidase domain 25 (testase 2) [Rattus norvegicus]|uniref:A disintegrin and metallopeptidase domain 25 n=1 Tax=Rattus norvegicus TaxID=10116 RepID=F1LWE4_RAT|nr:a disintegrin and metallopeptidase domain 25 (testase 2) [Rattus norvegicus]|eukprot:XP_003751651.1 PREDICTED: disintegrin and metalloproteinase domain-containing protein 25-like [Rattus norvegicus]